MFAERNPGSRSQPDKLPVVHLEAPKSVVLSGVRSARCKLTGLHLSERSLDACDDLAVRWADLAKRSLVANIFYEPQYAIPARLPFGHSVRILAVHADASPNAQLLGLWPFRLARFRWGLPLPVLLGWAHPFAASGVPLLDKDRADEALTALFGFPGLPRRALMPLVPDEGPFAEALARLQGNLGLREARTESHDRAYLTPGLAADALAHLSSGSRSKLRQEYRRLEKEGPVALEVADTPEKLGRALETYLELEAKGWKGRAGTAIPASVAETEFIRGVVRNLGAEGRVRIDELKLGERVIASSITYRNGATAWYAKISFDEEFAKNSPGSQLVVKVTEAMNADPSLNFIDSCAPPLHPLMRRFWPERMNLSNRMLELAGKDALFPLAVRLEQERPKVREYYHTAKRWLKDRRRA
jgi:hypothetical protein